jgi:hypothetical protein
MSPLLPPEVRVVTTPKGARYDLPWRATPPHFRWRSRVAAAAAVLALALAVYQFLQPPAPHRGKNSPPPWGFFLLAGAGVALVYASARRFTRCTAEVGPDKLVLREWQGPFPLERERPLDRVRGLVVHPLPGAAAEAGAVIATADGVIEVVCEGVQPVWWGHGYPQALLAPLAKDLAARCRVASRAAARDESPAAPPPFVEPPLRDSDSADVAEQPARSRAVLHRSPGGVTLTLPPAGYWGNERAVAMWALAIFWGLGPSGMAVMIGVDVLRHGLQYPWLWGFVAALLAVVPGVVLFVYENAERRTTLAVRGGRLTRIKTSPVFGPERLTWRREEILALRTATSKGGKGPPSVAVTVYPAGGEPVKLMESIEQQEMGWIATVLRQELGVPTVPGQPAPPVSGAASEDVVEEDVADEPKQPTGSWALAERTVDGLTVTLPAPGCRRDRRARVVLPFAVAAVVFFVLNGLAAGRVVVVGSSGAAEVAAVVTWLLGSGTLAAILAAWVVRRAGCRTTLRADEKGLAVVRSGPLLRPQRQEWPRATVAALRLGTAVPGAHGGKGFALRLHTRDGRAVNVLTGDDDAELRWLATVLRRALRVPAVPA